MSGKIEASAVIGTRRASMNMNVIIKSPGGNYTTFRFFLSDNTNPNIPLTDVRIGVYNPNIYRRLVTL